MHALIFAWKWFPAIPIISRNHLGHFSRNINIHPRSSSSYFHSFHFIFFFASSFATLEFMLIFPTILVRILKNEKGHFIRRTPRNGAIAEILCKNVKRYAKPKTLQAGRQAMYPVDDFIFNDTHSVMFQSAYAWSMCELFYRFYVINDGTIYAMNANGIRTTLLISFAQKRHFNIF